MKVALASGSIIKFRAVQQAWPKVSHIERVAVSSGVSEQPLGKDETYRGALNRAKGVMEKVKGCAFYIGIENGMFQVKETWVDGAAIVILRLKSGSGGYDEEVIWSDNIEIPKENLEWCLGKKDNKYFAKEMWSPLADPHREITKGKRPRKDFLGDALRLSKFYGEAVKKLPNGESMSIDDEKKGQCISL